MQFRSTAAALATAVIAVGAAGCAPRQVSDVPDDDRPTPETTPFLEPVSPPASDVDRPDDGFPADEGADGDAEG